MKTIVTTLICLIALVQVGLAQQKLYVQKVHVEQLSETSEKINSIVATIESAQKSNENFDSDERISITKMIFSSTGGCEGIARNVVNAKDLTQRLLEKNKMYEHEYEAFSKDAVDGQGYYAIQEGDGVQLTVYSQYLRSIKNQLKANGYRLSPGTPNAEENLTLVKQFNKTYASFVGLLQSRFVEL